MIHKKIEVMKHKLPIKHSKLIVNKGYLHITALSIRYFTGSTEKYN